MKLKDVVWIWVQAIWIWIQVICLWLTYSMLLGGFLNFIVWLVFDVSPLWVFLYSLTRFCCSLYALGRKDINMRLLGKIERI